MSKGRTPLRILSYITFNENPSQLQADIFTRRRLTHISTQAGKNSDYVNKYYLQLSSGKTYWTDYRENGVLKVRWTGSPVHWIPRVYCDTLLLAPCPVILFVGSISSFVRTHYYAFVNSKIYWIVVIVKTYGKFSGYLPNHIKS